MSDYLSRISCFREISVSLKENSPRRIVSEIKFDGDVFRLIFSYNRRVEIPDENLAGMISLLPVVNFALFTDKIIADFPSDSVDRKFISEMIRINNIETFINSICRRRYEFFRKDFLPDDGDISLENAVGRTEVEYTGEGKALEKLREKTSANGMGVMLSGGKESLLTFGMLREMGMDPWALFYNESGAHWNPAIPVNRYIRSTERDLKVWTNTDRLYRRMLRSMKILDQAAVSAVADTYPVQLFVFPVYLMAALPLMLTQGIGRVFMGNEFDDPREMVPYRGISHYYGIYDQSEEFIMRFNSYLSEKGIALKLLSALYPVSAAKVEETLISRYHDLYVMQRSCHSSRISGGEIIPCGRCSKCIGVISLILAAGGNPEEINYRKSDIQYAEKRLLTDRIRLDPDEAKYIISRMHNRDPGDAGHIAGFHILPGEKELYSHLNAELRDGFVGILKNYVHGVYELKDREWVQSPKYSF